jgi:hypothetical protein
MDIIYSNLKIINLVVNGIVLLSIIVAILITYKISKAMCLYCLLMMCAQIYFFINVL